MVVFPNYSNLALHSIDFFGGKGENNMFNIGRSWLIDHISEGKNKKSWLSISSSISFMRISSQQVFLGSRFCSSKCKRNKYPRPSNFSQGGMSWGYGLWICSIMGSLYSDMCPHFSCPFCPGNPNLLATGFNPCSTFCSQLKSQWHGLYTSLKKNWPHEEEPPIRFRWHEPLSTKKVGQLYPV